MCCEGSSWSTKRFLASIKPGVKYISGWKVLAPNGQSLHLGYQYSPGTHTAAVNVDTYPEPCTGIHFYTGRPIYLRIGIPVRVRVRPEDISLVSCEGDEAVATRIQIETREWIRAGLPMPQKRQAI